MRQRNEQKQEQKKDMKAGIHTPRPLPRIRPSLKLDLPDVARANIGNGLVDRQRRPDRARMVRHRMLNVFLTTADDDDDGVVAGEGREGKWQSGTESPA